MSTDLDDLLVRTSRTFAMSIPLLPEPTRREVEIAYLLFRIADTFEDATLWPPERKVAALELFGEILAAPPDPEVVARASREWVDDPPETHHQGYLDLLAASAAVMEAFWNLSDAARDVIRRHLSRTIDGMARFVSSGDGSAGIRLDSIAELRDYCYVVAGIVGEMLTDLYLLDMPDLDGVAPALRQRARDFGEGLQLVNILKDSTTDRAEGRVFLPRAVDRDEVFALAHRGLDRAAEYTLALQCASAPRGMVEFNAVPILLARATLDTVQRDGPGSKIDRSEVFRLVAEMSRRLDAGEDVV
jgi:farnesyl-diphosphate farnesyltransferase